MESKTNDLVYKIAERVKILIDEPIDYLRRTVSTGNSCSGIDPETRYRTKGDLVEEIITEEFLEGTMTGD